MAIDLSSLIRPAPRDNTVISAPLAGTRNQAVQRLQIGLFGLGAMVLLVGLANIIVTNSRENEAKVVPEAAPTVAAEGRAEPGSDPLAGAGVVPDLPDARAGARTGAGNASAPRP